MIPLVFVGRWPGASVHGGNGCNVEPRGRIGFEKAIRPKKVSTIDKTANRKIKLIKNITINTIEIKIKLIIP